MEHVYSTRREGGDIFAADMIQTETQSKIVDIFEDATVFITGGTGYLGKMFLEKLLRTCPKVKMIYLLLRPKKGKEVSTRFEEIFDGPNMVPLKIANPKYLDKVAMISGDCSLPQLGLDEDGKRKLLDEVNFVIHCAATVRFDEKIRQATYINVRAVKDLVSMAKEMKNLKGFLHVSTAFSHSPLNVIDETFYDPPISGDNLIKLVDMLEDDKLNDITKGLLGKWPNSYVFTKAIAEDIVNTEAKSLPIAVMRPSIVIASVTEPVTGWIDNFYGATGVLLGAALGLIRSLRGNKESIAEMIPADYVINSGLAILCEVTTKKSLNDNIETNIKAVDDEKIEEIPVYNVVSSAESPINWKQFTKLAEKHAKKVPTELQVWNYFFELRPNYYHHVLAVFLLHTVPAYLVDFICFCIRKEPMMVKGYQKINKFMDVISYFALKTWEFKNDNLQKLWRQLGEDDKRLFPFSMKDFDWDTYFYFYTRGGRVYLLKDPLDTVPKGRIKYWKLFIVHYILIAVILFIFYKLLCLLWACIF